MNDLKEINAKNRTCYSLDDIIRIEQFDFNNILTDEQSYGLIRFHDGTRFLVLLGSEIYDAIYNRIRYLIS